MTLRQILQDLERECRVEESVREQQIQYLLLRVKQYKSCPSDCAVTHELQDEPS